jgi:hypothetical protein
MPPSYLTGLSSPLDSPVPPILGTRMVLSSTSLLASHPSPTQIYIRHPVGDSSGLKKKVMCDGMLYEGPKVKMPLTTSLEEYASRQEGNYGRGTSCALCPFSEVLVFPNLNGRVTRKGVAREARSERQGDDGLFEV